jgi:hypothetical protein
MRGKDSAALEWRSIMNEEEIKSLEKTVRKLKRMASEKAGELHDLIEDRLPAAYEEIPALANATYEACKAWADAEKDLSEKTGGTADVSA